VYWYGLSVTVTALALAVALAAFTEARWSSGAGACEAGVSEGASVAGSIR